jgi:hypothetical protein
MTEPLVVIPTIGVRLPWMRLRLPTHMVIPIQTVISTRTWSLVQPHMVMPIPKRIRTMTQIRTAARVPAVPVHGGTSLVAHLKI